MEYTTVTTNALTGEVTVRAWTQEEIEARKAYLASIQPTPESITRRQCAKQLLALGMISSDEAIAMTRNGTPPAIVQAYLDNMQEPDRTSAIIDFAADTYLRSNPLLLALMAANGMTEKQVNEYFIAASQL